MLNYYSHAGRLLNRSVKPKFSQLSKKKATLRYHKLCTRNFSTIESTINDNNTSNKSEYANFGYTQIPKSEKETLVKEVFSSVAQSYDVMNDLMSFGIHRYWKDTFCTLTSIDSIARCIRSQPIRKIYNDNNEEKISSSFHVLDVAGGTGDVSFRLLNDAGCIERSKSTGEDVIKITVCDINPNMLQVGEERARSEFGDSIIDTTKALTFVEGNAEILPFEDNSFDLYTIAFGLRNVTNTKKALEEAYRVLKPGGRFMCLEFSKVEDCVLLSNIYDLYSFNVIPAIGEVVANDRNSYQYLVESIRTFLKQDELCDLMKAVHFEGVKYTNLTSGIVAIHEGWKL